MKLTRVKSTRSVGTFNIFKDDYTMEHEGTTYVINRRCNTGPGYSWVARDLKQIRETFARGTLKRLKETIANAHLRDARKAEKANARLIAAAPDLLESLRALYLVGLGSMADIEGDEDAVKAMAIAKAAIDKATAEVQP